MSANKDCMFQAQSIKLNESTAARRRVPFRLFDTAGNPIDVADPTDYMDTTIFKNGANAGAGAGTYTQVGSGCYYYEFTTGEVNTLGFLMARFYYDDGVSTTSQFWFTSSQVVAEDPYDSKEDEIDAIKAQTDKIVFDASNFVKSNAQDIQATVEEKVANAVWDEVMAGHGEADSAALYLKNSNILIESINPDALFLEALPAVPLEVGIKAFDLTGINGIGPAQVSNPGGMFIIRLRAGTTTVLYTGSPDVTGYGDGVILSKTVDLADLAIGDILYTENQNVQFAVGGFGYKPPPFKSTIRIQSRDDIIQGYIERILGLTHENIYVENTWDGEKHTASRIELYNSKANAEAHDGTTGLIALYNLTVTYSGTKPVSQVMSKDELT